MKSLGLLVVAGAAAYTYVIEPTWVKGGVGAAKCWWDGGVYVRADAREKGYRAMMEKSAENTAKLETGEAKGCLPEPKCALTPGDALGMVDRKIVSWGVVLEVQKKTLEFNAKMHDGVGFDLPGDGVATRVKAQAKVDEARYCTAYLNQTRATLVKAVSP